MRAENTNFRVVCAADNAEIYLYDVIGEDFFGGISAKMFADEMNKLKSVKNIDVRINSPGGNVFDGFTMYTLLKSSKANVNVFIDGLAASIASVIAMAGDSIEISSTGMMMIHDPSGMTFGSAQDHRKQADLLDKIRDQIVDVYASRTGLETTDLVDMMAAETWFNPQEAMDAKMADAVGADAAIAACLRPDLFKYKNMPKDLDCRRPLRRKSNCGSGKSYEKRSIPASNDGEMNMQPLSLTLKQNVKHIDMTNGEQVRQVLLRMAKAIDVVTPKKEYKLWSKNSKERAAAADPKKYKLWSKHAKA